MDSTLNALKERQVSQSDEFPSEYDVFELQDAELAERWINHVKKHFYKSEEYESMIDLVQAFADQRGVSDAILAD